MVNKGLQDAKKISSAGFFFSNYLSVRMDVTCKTSNMFLKYFLSFFSLLILLCSILITHVLTIIMLKVGINRVAIFCFTYLHLCDIHVYIFGNIVIFFLFNK